MTTRPETAPAPSALDETPASGPPTSEPGPVVAPEAVVTAAPAPAGVPELEPDGPDAARWLVARVHPFD